MLVRLFRDLHEHRDGKIIKHKAGTVVDLPQHVADYVNGSVVAQRKRVREVAQRFSFTPEFKK